MITLNMQKTYSKSKRIFFWSLAALFYFYEVILRVAPCSLTNVLRQDFHLNCTDLGLMVGSYYWAYALLQIPCGYIIDKIGARKVIAFSALICALGTYIFSETHNFYFASFGRILVGIGSSCAFISSLRIAIDWFPPVQFSFFAGITNMMGTLGGNFGGLPLAKLMTTFGWSQVFRALVIIGILISILTYVFMKDKKNSTKTSVQDIVMNLKLITKNKQIWLAGIIGGLLYLPITAVAELWGVPFLSVTYNIPDDVAAFSTNLVFIGTAIGSPIFALVALKLNSYKKTILITSIFTLVLFIVFTNARFFDINISWISLFLIGFMTGGQVLVFSIAKSEVSDEYVGVAIGFTNAMISFFGIIFQPFMGKILDFVWNGAVDANGVAVYNALQYQKAMFAMVIALIFSVALTKILKDKNIIDH
jgi:predicted MFS family arabinose efflux permease